MPSGSGKTIVGLEAIARTKLKTLIVVPTVDLLEQWKESISEKLSIPKEYIGVYGGGKKELGEITVTTYDSASRDVPSYGDLFGLLIVDEVHHLPAQSYRCIAEGLLARARLGLTATPQRSDEMHVLLPSLVGPIVYEVKLKELLRKGYVAKVKEKRIYVKLPPHKEKEYERLVSIYRRYLEKQGLLDMPPLERFHEVIKKSPFDPEARKALSAYYKARKLALNANEKLRVLEELLEKHRREKVIIFSRYTDIVDEISRRYLIPKITHETPRDERAKILEMFRRGEITKVVTAEVLDEGVDVPDAEVAIVISGSGSPRQYIQRLGRLLRPKKREATLYELITRETVDWLLSSKRRTLNLDTY